MTTFKPKFFNVTPEQIPALKLGLEAIGNCFNFTSTSRDVEVWGREGFTEIYPKHPVTEIRVYPSSGKEGRIAYFEFQLDKRYLRVQLDKSDDPSQVRDIRFNYEPRKA